MYANLVRGSCGKLLNVNHTSGISPVKKLVIVLDTPLRYFVRSLQVPSMITPSLSYINPLWAGLPILTVNLIVFTVM